jgi:hypothetical protein
MHPSKSSSVSRVLVLDLALFMLNSYCQILTSTIVFLISGNYHHIECHSITENVRGPTAHISRPPWVAGWEPCTSMSQNLETDRDAERI